MHERHGSERVQGYIKDAGILLSVYRLLGCTG